MNKAVQITSLAAIAAICLATTGLGPDFSDPNWSTAGLCV